ncbi:MAG: hypothetical protein J6A01_06535 [Proteobacteria bacterium]|nr:hypothetical protein [Pseudomonadota bacterium]
MRKSYLLIALLSLLSFGCRESVHTTQLPCRGDECPPCVEQCNSKGTMLYYCNSEGKQEILLCPGGCQHGLCYGPEEFCEDGDARCMDNQVLLVCTEGKWVYTPCELGCVDDACYVEPPECTTEPPFCISADTRQYCENEKWQTDVCDTGLCVDGACITPLPPCEEGLSECVDYWTRQYCQDAELYTENCDYICQNGQCIPEPSPVCTPGEGYCLDEVTLHYCQNGYWVDVVCEYRCQNGECISEDENYECPSGAGGCKDSEHGFNCIGHGWATIPCAEGCFGAFCQDTLRTCNGASECRDAETIMECVDGHFMDFHCPPGFACVDEVCEDANKPFYDPRATHSVCDPVESAYQYNVCNSLFDIGICVETSSAHTYYCIGGCDPNDPKPYMCENHYPYHRAFTGGCQTISNGQYAFIPNERYLCRNSCTPEEGCDEIIEVEGGHYRDDCTNIPNSCLGTKVYYCHGKEFTYDCAEAFGQGWTCAVDNGDVLCAEPCKKEGEVLNLCMNMPVVDGFSAINYTKTCKRFDDGKLYYRQTYGKECKGECNSAGTRCISKSNHPDCSGDAILENCDKTNPHQCPDAQVCVTDGENLWCAWPVTGTVENQSFCATNNVTNKTFYQVNERCYVYKEDSSSLDVVRVEYIEYCATSECDSNSGCLYVE